MRHKITNPHAGRETRPREEKVQPILEKAIEACAKHGGAAEIGMGYVIVDTGKYNVTLKG